VEKYGRLLLAPKVLDQIEAVRSMGKGFMKLDSRHFQPLMPYPIDVVRALPHKVCIQAFFPVGFQINIVVAVFRANLD
jgi:hypothetical protein